MNRSHILILLAFVGGATVVSAEAPLKGSGLLSKTRITPDAAKQDALAARPGRITDAELEKEHGGSGLRYSFDILAGGSTYEVGVDAKTGVILENDVESKTAD